MLFSKHPHGIETWKMCSKVAHFMFLGAGSLLFVFLVGGRCYALCLFFLFLFFVDLLHTSNSQIVGMQSKHESHKVSFFYRHAKFFSAVTSRNICKRRKRKFCKQRRKMKLGGPVCSDCSISPSNLGNIPKEHLKVIS